MPNFPILTVTHALEEFSLLLGDNYWIIYWPSLPPAQSLQITEPFHKCFFLLL